MKNFTKGFLKENPVFVLLLGMCPTLGVTSSAINGMGMGLATTFVLVMANFVVSLVKSGIPDKVRIPSFIVIIATFVTIVQLTMQLTCLRFTKAWDCLSRLSWSTVSYWDVPKRLLPKTPYGRPSSMDWAWDWVSPSR